MTMQNEAPSPAGEQASTEVVTGCRVCSGRLSPALVARELMLGSREAFAYDECLDCGGLQIRTPPPDLDRFYEDTYYTRRRDRVAGWGRPVRGLRRWASRMRLGTGPLSRPLSGRRYARFDWFRRTRTGLDDTILDVGCGSGRLLARLAHDGFTRLTGIDPHWHGPEGHGPEGDGPEEALPGVRITREGPAQHEGRYRLVMAHHSFEHMSEPSASFEAMVGLVEPGGHLLLRVPLADSWARRSYGADWVQLDAPRHLHVPTRRSIAILARRAGLEIVHVEDDSGPFQIWGSELYRRDCALVDGGRRGRAALPLRTRWTARLRAHRLARANLGDQACFYLRRE